MKTLGAALVLAAAGLIWGPELRRQRREVDTLRRLGAALARMEGAIQSRRLPLPRLLGELAEEGPLGRQWAMAAAALAEGRPLPELLRRCAEEWGLSPWCCQTLFELGCALGGEAEESTQALALARQRILGELEEKRQSLRERSRRGTVLCFSAAAFVIILLL